MKFEELIGKTIAAFEGAAGGDEIRITTTDAKVYRMWHSQDCCESVYIESIVGDPQDLIGVPILKAEESTSDEAPEGATQGSESNTWTFYKLATIKGYVDIRWHGNSNGYYSESVDFEEME